MRSDLEVTLRLHARGKRLAAAFALAALAVPAAKLSAQGRGAFGRGGGDGSMSRVVSPAVVASWVLRENLADRQRHDLARLVAGHARLVLEGRAGRWIQQGWRIRRRIWRRRLGPGRVVRLRIRVRGRSHVRDGIRLRQEDREDSGSEDLAEGGQRRAGGRRRRHERAGDRRPSMGRSALRSHPQPSIRSRRSSSARRICSSICDATSACRIPK